MAAAEFELEIATPERLLVRERCTEAQIPGARGYLGILPGHSPILGELGTGELSYVSNGHKRYLAVEGGFFEVANDRVRVLATSAERSDEIDTTRAEAALKRALDRLSKPELGMDIARALNAMQRAKARLAASQH
jgi:F-type H+-transporting ATPase subunit epsilon